MVVMFKHPCVECGQDTFGEVHRECVEKYFQALPAPETMTPEQRFREVWYFRAYPAGWPLDLLQSRVEALIGRSFRKGGQVPTDTLDPGAMIAWLHANEHTPQWTDEVGWLKYAEEARDRTFPALVEKGGE